MSNGYAAARARRVAETRRIVRAPRVTVAGPFRLPDRGCIHTHRAVAAA